MAVDEPADRAGGDAGGAQLAAGDPPALAFGNPRDSLLGRPRHWNFCPRIKHVDEPGVALPAILA
ncbi:MAG: hypothetical protein ACRDL8_01065 [Solirubrobacteraceae bacterium]